MSERSNAPQTSSPKDDPPSSEKLVSTISLLLDLISIHIRRVHIRFEDDLYSASPYSVGLVIDEFKVINFDKDIVFDSPLSV